MSRDAIAEVLGRLDYGDHSDEVDWRDRLTEVDGLLASGEVVDVDELLWEEDRPSWRELRRVLQPLGWKPLVTWPGQLALYWVPPRTDPKRIDDGLTPYAEASYRRVRYSGVLCDDGEFAGDNEFDSADDLLTWLATP